MKALSTIVAADPSLLSRVRAHKHVYSMCIVLYFAYVEIMKPE